MKLKLVVNSQQPDGYLARSLENLFKRKDINAITYPYVWSRYPGDSNKAVQLLKVMIEHHYKISTYEKLPFVIVAHSWGGVLSYVALKYLSDAGKKIKVEKLITLGTPLGSKRTHMKIFNTIERIKENLAIKNISKPSNVRYWSNLWAEYGLASGSIRLDTVSNYQVDRDAVRIVEEAQAYYQLKKLKELEKKDSGFTSLADTLVWHESYYKGVHIQFESYKDRMKIGWDIPGDYLDQFAIEACGVEKQHRKINKNTSSADPESDVTSDKSNGDIPAVPSETGLAIKSIEKYYPIKENMVWKYRANIEMPSLLLGTQRAGTDVLITGLAPQTVKNRRVFPVHIKGMGKNAYEFMAYDNQGLYLAVIQSSKDTEP